MMEAPLKSLIVTTCISNYHENRDIFQGIII